MRALIFMGSPQREGCTAALLRPFQEELEAAGLETETVRLYDLDIRPCRACRRCQRDWSSFHCVQGDDVQELFDRILDSGLTVWAAPIYAWYCPAPMKALLDRLAYGMNKFYGEDGRKGPSLWRGKALALLLACGYPPERGTDLFEEGMRRYCRHSGLRYLGAHAERHLGYDVPFMDGDKERRTRAFARELLASLEG